MYTATKSKIRPSKRQYGRLVKAFGAFRYVYNWALQYKKEQYSKNKRTVGYRSLIKSINEMKQNQTCLQDVDTKIVEQAIYVLKSAFEAYSKGRAGFPKFKRKANDQTIRMVDGFSLCGNVLQTDLFGDFQLEDRFSLTGDIRFLTIELLKNGDFYVAFNYDDDKELPELPAVEKDSAVGIDLGIHTLIYCSDGRHYSNPEFYHQALPRLNKLKKKLESKEEGSNTYKEIQRTISNELLAVENRRKDYYHKIINDLLTAGYSTIFIEKLDIQRMMSIPSIKDRLVDTQLFLLIRMLKYKARRAGINVIEIDPFYPSSQVCHCCGFVNKKLTLHDRHWRCPDCGAELERDYNAAINILHRGLNLSGIT